MIDIILNEQVCENIEAINTMRILGFSDEEIQRKVNEQNEKDGRMIITIVTTTILPQTELGIKIANEMEQNRIQQGYWPSRKETTQTITITESHTITMSEVEE